MQYNVGYDRIQTENMATIIANLRKSGKTISNKMILSADEVHAFASMRVVRNSGIGTVGKALGLDDLDKVVLFVYLFVSLFVVYVCVREIESLCACVCACKRANLLLHNHRSGVVK